MEKSYFSLQTSEEQEMFNDVTVLKFTIDWTPDTVKTLTIYGIVLTFPTLKKMLNIPGFQLSIL